MYFIGYVYKIFFKKHDEKQQKYKIHIKVISYNFILLLLLSKKKKYKQTIYLNYDIDSVETLLKKTHIFNNFDSRFYSKKLYSILFFYYFNTNIVRTLFVKSNNNFDTIQNKTKIYSHIIFRNKYFLQFSTEFNKSFASQLPKHLLT